MATTADFKNGLCINFNGDVWQIVEFQHVKPGKGNAFVRTRLKNLKNGKVLANTFPAGVKIDTARVERRPYQFLYKDETGYNFARQISWFMQKPRNLSPANCRPIWILKSPIPNLEKKAIRLPMP